MSIFEGFHCIVKREIRTPVCVVSQPTMDDIKVELDLHSDTESTSLISDDENVEGTSVTVPIMKCEAEVSVFFFSFLV
jgi:hypothetical protein